MNVDRRADLRSRAHVISRLSIALGDHSWAFQGATGAVHRWVTDDSMDDLDIWVARESAAAVDGVLRSLGGVLVCSTGNPVRLMHRQYWMPTENTTSGDGEERSKGALVDVTVGDLKVGPMLLLGEEGVAVRLAPVLVESSTTVHAPVLAGAARVADLVIRPLLRGRVVQGSRLHDASVEFLALAHSERSLLRATLRRVVGSAHVVDVEQWLLGSEPLTPMATVRDRTRRRLMRSTLAPRSLRATWSQRSIVLPTRRPGPVGLRTGGVVVALVGTDGSGKSTTAERLAVELRAAGFVVDHQYFGMARGNLPGVGLIRRLAGGGNTTAAPSASPAPSAGSPGLLHRAAAWVYVVDYWWRAARRVRPAVRRGHVVICDRWVSDLRRHPSPGSPAATLAERIVGAPDLFVLADAPVDEMVARKPERTMDEAQAEQAGLRAVGVEMADRRARGGGRCRFLVVDTSARTPTDPHDRIGPVVAGIVAAAHRGLPHDRPGSR